MLYQGFTLLSLQKLPKVLSPCSTSLISDTWCLPACLFVYLPVCLPACLLVNMPVSLSAFLYVYLPVCLPAYLHVDIGYAYLPVSQSVCLPACLHTSMSVCISVCLPISQPACLPTSMSVCQSACLSAYQHVCLSICLPCLNFDVLFTKTNTDRRKTFHRCHVLFWTRLRSSSKCGVFDVHDILALHVLFFNHCIEYASTVSRQICMKQSKKYVG